MSKGHDKNGEPRAVAHNRIESFISLPISSWDRLSLQVRLEEIGRR